MTVRHCRFCHQWVKREDRESHLLELHADKLEPDKPVRKYFYAKKILESTGDILYQPFRNVMTKEEFEKIRVGNTLD